MLQPDLMLSNASESPIGSPIVGSPPPLPYNEILEIDVNDPEVGPDQAIDREEIDRAPTPGVSTPPPEPRRRANTRKQTLLPRLEHIEKRKAHLKRKRDVVKLYEMDSSDPEIDEVDKGRIRKAKKDRDFRMKKNSDLQTAQDEVAQLRTEVEKHKREIERLQEELKRKDEAMELKPDDWEDILAISITDLGCG